MLRRYFYFAVFLLFMFILIGCAPQDYRPEEISGPSGSALAGEAISFSPFKVACAETQNTLELTYTNRSTNATVSTQSLPRFVCGRSSSGANISYQRSCSLNGVFAITQTVICKARCDNGYCVQSGRSVVGVDTGPISTNASISRNNWSAVNVSRSLNGTIGRPANVSRGFPLTGLTPGRRNTTNITISSTLSCGSYVSSESCRQNSSCSWTFNQANGSNQFYECVGLSQPHSCDFYNSYGNPTHDSNSICSRYNTSCSWTFNQANGSNRFYECVGLSQPHSCDFYNSYGNPTHDSNSICSRYNTSCSWTFNQANGSNRFYE